MSDDDHEDQSGPRTPSQIPLLVDVIENKKPARVRRKPKKENYSLDLNPDPPTTLDLFAEPGADHPGSKETAQPTDDTPPAPPTDVPVGPDPAIEAEMEARFRRDANELVESLVKQYSEEILHRLREELTSLLDDLDATKDGEKKEPGEPTSGES